GNNKYKQLGYTTSKENRYVPKLIEDLDNVKQVAAGNKFSIVLKMDGTIYGFGRYSQFKISSHIPRLIPDFNKIVKISAGNHHFLALDNNGNVLDKENIIDIFAGNDYS